ncbi:unnamed protein product [Macrosiphum euphorbiae]|uniref:Uncharacterized protein n=1 Tax=Macrosiphum euphorbiae TaxID=13131 RepID=A0AAV0WJN9_9HEMI|nr:unnamed protein product [Macrosiphum euphorbiae]
MGRRYMPLAAGNRMPLEQVYEHRSSVQRHMKCLKYAHENGCPWEEDTCLAYAFENGCYIQEYTCSQATLYGHLEYLNYAREIGCHWNK